MPYIDIGANLSNSRYLNCLEDVLKDAKEWFVEKIILTGTNMNTTKFSNTLVYRYPKYNLYYTAGIHPHNVKELDNNSFSILTKYIEDKKCVAIGECGLDYNRMFSPKHVQLYWFEEQIKLSIKHNKPLFLHERDAFDDFYNILFKYKNEIKGVVHCFTGNYEQMNKYLDLGMYIGITGWLCDDRRNKDLVDAIQKLDKKYLDRIMVETDCPFLSPVKKDSFNVPSYIYYVVVRLAKELNMKEKDVEKIVYQNTLKFFNL